ncbi:MAG: glycosyltransferase family 1 protein [Solirubrobacterales bacterium]|nr:glycosyltransferase family 1 protein [Solirubrobacterales bacterium]
MSAGEPLRGRDIVCVGFSDWGNDLLTNEQHLLVRLAAGNRILFVESLGLRRPQVARRDVRRILRRLVRGVMPARAVDGLHVISPLVLPLHDKRWAQRFNARVLPWLVTRATRRLGFRDVVLWTFVPQAEVLIEQLKPATVLYYVDDDHAAKKGIDAPSFRAAEERIARRADVVLGSAPELVERMRELNPNVHEAFNVADTAAFAEALEPGPEDPAVAALPAPRVVFAGAIIASKIDIPLVREMSALRPGWSFAFVGPIGPGDPGTDVGGLEDLPNVHLLGHRPYEELPQVLRSGAVAILPYHVHGEMRSVFPMKTYEYLAAGLPVVSTRLPALAEVDEVVKVTGAAAMVAAIEAGMAADSPEARRARSARVQGFSWESRLILLGDVLGSR